MDEIGRVVVGVDGSPASHTALVHALRDAQRRKAELRVVAAAQLPEYWVRSYGMGNMPSPVEVVADMRGAVQLIVDDVVAAHPGDTAGVPITVEAVAGAPGPVLIEAAQGADLLVVGHRGHGAMRSTLLGSVGLHCVPHATCPVTIVRPVKTNTAEPAAAATV